MAGLGSIQAQTQQLRSDAKDEGWGNRQSNTSQGKLLWFEHVGVSNTDDVYLYDGASANLAQAQGALTGVGDNVFALGTGFTAGHVIGAWRRETDFAWISVDGNSPVSVQATNPIDAMQPLKPEGAAIADGCTVTRGEMAALLKKTFALP